MKMISFLKISALLLFLILILNCTTEPEDNYGNTIIKGVVVDLADSTPIESVLVTLSYSKLLGYTTWIDLEPLTDSAGCFNYNYYCMKDYAYRIEFSKEGYLFNNYPYMIEKDKTNNFFVVTEKESLKTKSK